MSGDIRIAAELAQELDVAETKAWESLARYKFMQFGYWVAIWVHLNRIGHFKRPNPWVALVKIAREWVAARLAKAPAKTVPLFDQEAA